RFPVRPFPRRADDLARDGRGDVAALEVERPVEEPTPMEPQGERSIRIASERVLHLVSVVKGGGRRDDGPGRRPNPSQVRQTLLDLAFLVAELLRVLEILRAASAAHRDMGTPRL